MEQVPEKSFWGLLGDGRAARHFAHYFSLKGIPFRQWSRKSPDSAESTLGRCTTLFLLISDDALPFITEQHPFLKKKFLVHASGSRFFPEMCGLHPLTSFSPRLRTLEEYEEIPFVVDHKTPEVQKLLTQFKNPHVFIRPEEKPLYHALCVLSGNFTALLWKSFADGLKILGLPSTVLLNPYLRSVFNNIASNPQSALSGPLLRKDFGTLQRNEEALRALGLDQLYRCFTEVFGPTLSQDIERIPSP